MTLENAKIYFEQYTNTAPHHFQKLPQSGSSRINYIAKNEKNTYIVTQNNNIEENESFFYFSKIFTKLKLNTPKIFNISDDKTTYIQEFLGDETLSQIIEKEGESEKVKQLVYNTLNQLFCLQKKTINKIDYSKTFEYEEYNHLPILNDLNYFKFMFLDILEIPYKKSDLLKEFYLITEKIENIEPKSLMIRDFQARNILVNNQNETSFIDYQSAMKGPAIYDVVSLLFQAKANFSEPFQQEMLSHYITLYHNDEIEKKLWQSIPPIRLIRNLQVLGAYGFRGLIQRKKHFISSIEKGIENIAKTANSWEEINLFPTLKNLTEILQSQTTKQKINKILKP